MNMQVSNEVNKLADKVGINLIYSNLIGQNYQPWYKYRWRSPWDTEACRYEVVFIP